jgi:hypothetical protein
MQTYIEDVTGSGYEALPLSIDTTMEPDHVSC